MLLLVHHYYYQIVVEMLAVVGIKWQPLHMKNSKHQVALSIQYLLVCYWKVIEAKDSLIKQLLPKHIHAVTPQGFELNVAILLPTASFNFLKAAA